MKNYLSSSEEILEYLMNLDDNMDEDSVRSYLEESGPVHAYLRVIQIEDLDLGPEDNHLEDNRKQSRYNKFKTEAPPILVEENGHVIDGHHRVRAAKFQKKMKYWRTFLLRSKLSSIFLKKNLFI